MKEIDLAYGQRSVPLAIDDERFQVLHAASSHPSSRPLNDAEIGAAIDTPVAGPGLPDLLNPGETVLIVVSDATRATGSAQLVNLLVRRIIQNGVEAGNIAIIFATGIHRAVTAAEKIALLTPFIVQRIRTIDHDAGDPEFLLSLDTTTTGIPVEVNRALREYDHVILIGGIAFHYFAGFTGGRKSICPGLAGAQTIKQTHMLALDLENGGRRAGVGTGLLQGNPVHDACDEVASLIAPSLGINTTVDERGRVVHVVAGNWRDAHRVACEQYLAAHSIGISQKRRLVIASCGGSPYDINLIQAHKTMEMASHACEAGGTIILLAECADGLGRADFLKWFTAAGSGELEKRLRTDYEVNGQTAWSLLSKTERYRVFLISELPEDQVRKMGMIPAQSIEAALNEGGPEAGYVLPRGAAYLPLLNADEV
jgi:lactate racemase